MGIVMLINDVLRTQSERSLLLEWAVAHVKLDLIEAMLGQVRHGARLAGITSLVVPCILAKSSD